MKTVISILMLATVFAGCATKPLPICDGADRRPVNQPAKTIAAAVYNSCSAGQAA